MINLQAGFSYFPTTIQIQRFSPSYFWNSGWQSKVKLNNWDLFFLILRSWMSVQCEIQQLGSFLLNFEIADEPLCYVWQCYMCIDLKGCLGVRCHICRCVGAPWYTMLIFGFFSLGVSQYLRRSQCNCIIKYNYLYYNYIMLLLQYHKYTYKYTLICIASCSHCCKCRAPTFSL